MSNIFDMQKSDYGSTVDMTGFDPQKLDDHHVDQHFAVLDEAHRIRARCSIWWRDTASMDGRRIGAIGHYSADSEEYACDLLEHACTEIKRRGCGLAVGPLDGSTWRRYRFITRRGSAKPFFLEPDNPDDWPLHFSRAGFDRYADYVSEMNPDIENRQPELGDLTRKFEKLGVDIERVDLDAPADCLYGIYQVVCEAFAGGLFFTPLDFDEFTRMYAPLIAATDPGLMFIARHEGRVIGFIFAPPDLLQHDDPALIDTIVIKTVAVLPRSEYRGLGRVLIVKALQSALDMGYRRAISALMYSFNRSQRISSVCAAPMRRYSLFARQMN